MTSKSGANFKRPCWLALYVTLGMTMLGKACEILLPFLNAPYPGMIFWLGGLMLMYLGIYGCVVSLVWWSVAAIISVSRQRHRMQP